MYRFRDDARHQGDPEYHIGIGDRLHNDYIRNVAGLLLFYGYLLVSGTSLETATQRGLLIGQGGRAGESHRTGYLSPPRIDHAGATYLRT